MSKRKKPSEMQVVKNEADRKYYHMMLNMADDDLDPYQYRLLGHYLRWGGHGGDVPEGLRETAKTTRMGINKVRSTRKDLSDLGYLRVQEASEEDIKNGVPAVVTIIDRWAENISRYAKPRIQSDTPPVSNPIQGMPDPRIDLDTPPVSEQIHSEERIEEPKQQEEETPVEILDIPIVKENADTVEQVAIPPTTPGSAAPPSPPTSIEIADAIMAWWETLPEKPANIKSTRNIFGNPTNRTYAVNMLKTGITPDDIRTFVRDKTRAGAFYSDKHLSFGKVAEELPAWKRGRKPQASTNPIHKTINLDEAISKDDYIDPRFKALNDALAEKMTYTKEAKKPA